MQLLKQFYRRIFSPIYRTIEVEKEERNRELEDLKYRSSLLEKKREEIVEQFHKQIGDILQKQEQIEKNDLEYKEKYEKLSDKMFDYEKREKEIENKIEGIHNSIQYFGDIMAEKSFLIQSNTNDIKQNFFALKRHDIQLYSILKAEVSKEKKIFQVVPVFREGDAVCNYALFIQKTLEDNNIYSEIYTYENLSDRRDIKSIEELFYTNKKDIILYHMAAENDFAEIIEAYSAKKVLVYHNITPSQFFHDFDEIAEISTKNGRIQVSQLIEKVDFCITDSEYNKLELIKMGYNCPIYVISIPFVKEKFEQIESKKVKEEIADGTINFLFVGRIVPNKKIEDLISIYQYYYDNYNTNVRLILVGVYKEDDRYYKFLKEKIRVKDNIVFTGYAPTENWITYYKYADIFLCMSEHEGFCVPLLEAMSYGLPIIAYSAGAVPETLGEGGVIVDNKDIAIIAKLIDKMLCDTDMIKELNKKQKQVLTKYNSKKISEEWFNIIQRI